ncbi:MAG: VOC family protein, partial [Acidimicrobiales bacterium]
DYTMLQLAQAGPGRRTTGAEIGFTVDDVDALHQRAGELGVSVVEAPHDEQWGRSATYEDPDGNTVYLTAG